MRHSSFEDEERSTTGAFPKEPPYSNTGECGRREETSDGDPSGSGDPYDDDIAVTERPNDITVEIAKESPGKLLIT
jgi:hypothetical protein